MTTTDDLVAAAGSRRQAVLMLVVINTLVLAVGAVAVVDLRRLQTPGGTALRWVEAAVFGDCDDYRAYSVAVDATDPRSPEQVCRDLRASTSQARTESSRIGLELGGVRRHGAEATAEITLSRAEERLTLTVNLVQRDGRWRVLRDVATCTSVGCA